MRRREPKDFQFQRTKKMIKTRKAKPTPSTSKPAARRKAGPASPSGNSEASRLEMAGRLAALDRDQATIELNLDRTVITANQNFLSVLGYALDEIQGKHHRMFCDPAYVASPDYEAFWAKLRRGEFDAGTYRRLGKGGKEVWIQASYNPILDAAGKPYKVVKFATDVTDQRNRASEFEGKMAAIDKVQATIEFGLDGTVLTANANFLQTLGYRLEEIRGRHHRTFCEPSYVASPDYEALKFATDITEQRRAQDRLALLMGEVQKVMGGVAGGDLTNLVNGQYSEDLEKTKGSINAAVAKLRELVPQINASASTITSGASDIAEGNASLNKRTQDQSSALEETASSLEEMPAPVKQPANNATQANQLALP